MRDVVVIGSGFGALKAVSELRRRDRRLAITLAAPRPHFHDYPSLVWVPARRRAPEALTVDIRDWLARRGRPLTRAASRPCATAAVRW